MKREMEYLYKELTEENKLHAPVLLKSMIRAEKFGKKVGQGWYKYLKKLEVIGDS